MLSPESFFHFTQNRLFWVDSNRTLAHNTTKVYKMQLRNHTMQSLLTQLDQLFCQLQCFAHVSLLQSNNRHCIEDDKQLCTQHNGCNWNSAFETASVPWKWHKPGSRELRLCRPSRSLRCPGTWVLPTSSWRCDTCRCCCRRSDPTQSSLQL